MLVLDQVTAEVVSASLVAVSVYSVFSVRLFKSTIDVPVREITQGQNCT